MGVGWGIPEPGEDRTGQKSRTGEGMDGLVFLYLGLIQDLTV